ncbi:MAG: hypothetical protein L0Z73_06935 [Gammaproteobacteria bacterium]|nr:hypothetical protein [Gammaproteobacteria bacterium]
MEKRNELHRKDFPFPRGAWNQTKVVIPASFNACPGMQLAKAGIQGIDVWIPVYTSMTGLTELISGKPISVYIFNVKDKHRYGIYRP